MRKFSNKKPNKEKKRVLPISLIKKEFSPRSEMKLPRICDVAAMSVFGTVLTALVQFPGRSICVNFPERSYNNASNTQMKNYTNTFNSTSGKYIYGCVLRAHVTLLLQNLEVTAVKTGVVFVPPLQTIANNYANDLTVSYQKTCLLAPAGNPTATKVLKFTVDLPKLYHMSDDQYQTLPALWFSQGGAPSTVAYVYHQMYRIDGSAFASGVDVTCDVQYEIQPTSINIGLTV